MATQVYVSGPAIMFSGTGSGGALQFIGFSEGDTTITLSYVEAPREEEEDDDTDVGRIRVDESY